jgi:hypothetical protein
VKEVERPCGPWCRAAGSVPHHRAVLNPSQRVRLTVVRDHDHGKTRHRALARQRYREEVGARQDSLRNRTLWASRTSTTVRRSSSVDCFRPCCQQNCMASSILASHTHPAASPRPCPRTRAAVVGARCAPELAARRSGPPRAGSGACSGPCSSETTIGRPWRRRRL